MSNQLDQVSIDVEIDIGDPKQARVEALMTAREAFRPGPKDTLVVTYLSDGTQRLNAWHFTATVTWTPSPSAMME